MRRGIRVVTAAALGLALVAIAGAGHADHAEGLFGAIAYDPGTGAVGLSETARTQGLAEGEALTRCGPGCAIAIWFRNACGALAVGSDGWGANWGVTRPEASDNALAACGRHTSGCAIRQLGCTGY
jgi:serine/threonine-protein kinase